MAAIICVGVMLAVWIVILVVLFTAKRDVPGMYTSFRTGESYSSGTAYARHEQTWNATSPSAPRYSNPIRYQPEMPAPLAPPPQQPRVEPAHDIAPVWTVSLSRDTIEHQLLAALRVRPHDSASRMVYSDWLEQRGELVKAAYVRGDDLQLGALAEVAGTTDVTWRSITSREHVACVAISCPKRWDQLDTFDDDERTRRCPACDRTVRYCATTDEARWIRVSGDMPVIDLAGQLPPLFRAVDDRFDATAA